MEPNIEEAVRLLRELDHALGISPPPPLPETSRAWVGNALRALGAERATGDCCIGATLQRTHGSKGHTAECLSWGKTKEADLWR